MNEKEFGKAFYNHFGAWCAFFHFPYQKAKNIVDSAGRMKFKRFEVNHVWQLLKQGMFDVATVFIVAAKQLCCCWPFGEKIRVLQYMYARYSDTPGLIR